MCLIINYFFWCLLTPLIACSQQVADHLKYLEQDPPTINPEIFAPGLVSKNTESEFGSVFNKEATAFFYGVDVDGRTEIKHLELRGKRWSEPKTILSNVKYGFNDPFLLPDEKRLYFIS